MYESLLVFVIVNLLLLLAIKLYIKLTTGINNTYTCLIGKTVIITGGNSGIGFVTALELAKRGARIILACRNRKLAENAKNKIIRQTDNSNIVVKYVDMTSLETIRKFVQDVNETEDHVDVLINNAGVAVGLEDKYTDDGLQITMQTNYFGSVYLTQLLLDKLKKSKPSRIINMSSVTSKFCLFDVDKINSLSMPIFGFNNAKHYVTSKLCLILYTIALAKRLKGTGVSVYSLHPGVIRTKIFDKVGGILENIVSFLLYHFCKNVEEGVQTTIYLATSKDVEDKSGRFFDECKEHSYYWNVNEDLAEQLWFKTQKLLQFNHN